MKPHTREPNPSLLLRREPVAPTHTGMRRHSSLSAVALAFISLLGAAAAFVAPPAAAAPSAFRASPLRPAAGDGNVRFGSGYRSFPSALSSSSSSEIPSVRDDLLSCLSKVNAGTNDRLPAGLECSDKTRALIMGYVEALEADEETNLVQITYGQIDVKDMVGDWILLYTDSKTMIINRSLSGLGRSESDSSRFGSLTQKLRGNKWLSDIEYVERIDTGDEESSFDVTVVGDFELKSGSVNVETDGPCAVMTSELKTLTYGVSVNDAETWVSLGPARMTDVVYLSEDLDLYIARGHIRGDSIFVWKRLE